MRLLGNTPNRGGSPLAEQLSQSGHALRTEMASVHRSGRAEVARQSLGLLAMAG